MPVIKIDQVEELIVEATSFCNLHCPQCGRFDEDGFLAKGLTTEHLSTDAFTNAIISGAFPNLKVIRFEGDHGDVMMHPHAKELIEYSATIASVLVVTNGSIRSSQWWSDLAKIKNLKVIFSIDGLEDTNHLYRINSDYNKIINNACAFINNGGTAEWKFIVFKHNQHQIEQAQNHSIRLGFKSFNTVSTARNFWGNKTVWPVKVEGKNLGYDIEISDLTSSTSYRSHISSKIILKSEKHIPPECSWAHSKQMFLNFKGHLLPCCMVSGKTWTGDMSSKLWMRILKNSDNIDIAKHTIEEILNGDFYRKDLKESLDNPKRVHHLCVSSCGG